MKPVKSEGKIKGTVSGTNAITRVTVEPKTYPERCGPRYWTSLAIGRDNKHCDTHYGAVYVVTKMDGGDKVNDDLLTLFQAAPGLRDALKALVDQISWSNWVEDEHGHNARNLKALHDAREALAKVGL